MHGVLGGRAFAGAVGAAIAAGLYHRPSPTLNDATGALVVVACVATACLAERALAAEIPRPLIVLTPAALCRLDLLRAGGVSQSLRYLVKSLVLLATLLYLVVVPRILPLLLPLSSLGAFEAQVLGALPPGLEVRIRNGTMRMSPPPADGALRVEVPQAAMGLAGGRLLEALETWDIGVADLQLVGAALRVLAVGERSAVRDPYVRLAEFSEGEAVEALANSALASACGGGWRPALCGITPLGGLWVPAIVEEVRPALKLADFKYKIRVADAAGGPPPGNASAGCVVVPSQLRRRRVACIAVDGDSGASLSNSELREESALMYFEAERFAIFEGYSFQYGSHWQYWASGEAPTQRAKLWHKYDSSGLHNYTLLSWFVSVYCHESADGDILCSHEVAREQLQRLLEDLPLLALLLRCKLLLPISLCFGWAVVVAVTLLCRGCAILLIYLPMAYVACALFRHVDTPMEPVSGIFALVTFTSIPAVALRRIALVVWAVWGKDGLLPPVVATPTQWALQNRWHVLWALWNAFLAMKIRAHAQRQEHLERVLAARGGRSRGAEASSGVARPQPPPAAAPADVAEAAAQGAGVASDDVGALEPKDFGAEECRGGLEEGAALKESDGLGPHAMSPTGDLPGSGAAGAGAEASASEPAAARCGGLEDSLGDERGPGGRPGDLAETSAAEDLGGLDAASAIGPGATFTNMGGGASSREASEGHQEEPVCRICYGGQDVGRLVTPCLCAGTLRFIHLDCLNTWRRASANPESFYQCDQCHYRYCFQRAVYASILRSAIVLLSAALVAFVGAVLACTYACAMLDQGFVDSSTFQHLVHDMIPEELANETDAKVLRETLMEVVSMSWHGVRVVHLVSGWVMVGLSGVLSMGFVFPFIGVRGYRVLEGPVMILTILVGSVRMFCMIYRLFKSWSGRLLQSAETMVLEVGPGVEADAAQPTSPAADHSVGSASTGADVGGVSATT